jgi:hypothetical protein
MELSDQRLHVADVLGRAASGGDRQAHGRERTWQVPVELTEVGDPGIGRELRLDVDVVLERALRRPVAAELDLSIGDHSIVAGHARADPGGLLAERERAAEVVTGQGERTEAAGGGEVSGIEPQSLLEGALCPRIEGRIARLAHLLEVGEPELGVGVGIGRRLAHLGL